MISKAETIRNKIISTADDLFYRQGFNHTSFADISKAVGISRGNFYYHFKTKDDILAAVLEERKASMIQMLSQWSNELSQPMARLLAFVEMIASSRNNIIKYGCPIGTACGELSKLKNINYSDATEIIALFRHWLVEQIELLGHKHNKADQLAMHILTCAQGISVVGLAFKDADYIVREVDDLKQWLKQL